MSACFNCNKPLIAKSSVPTEGHVHLGTALCDKCTEGVRTMRVVVKRETPNGPFVLDYVQPLELFDDKQTAFKF